MFISNPKALRVPKAKARVRKANPRKENDNGPGSTNRKLTFVTFLIYLSVDMND